MKRRKIWWIVGGVVVVAVAGISVTAASRGPKPTSVQTAEVGREDLQAKVTANGKVQAQKKVEISATISGQVTQLAVREGDVVTKGQFLLQIDSVNPRAAALRVGWRALSVAFSHQVAQPAQAAPGARAASPRAWAKAL